jgi:hypothetical protein
VFPNLKTLWGYNGAAPSPAAHHLRAWSSATRGRKDDLDPSAHLKADNVAVWSSRGNYRDAGPPIEALLERAGRANARFDALSSGQLVARSPTDEPCEGDYRAYRSLSQHPMVPAAERSLYKDKADVLLRIRYYDRVRVAFVEQYRAQLAKGYAALGAAVPPFETMSRAEAVMETRRLGAKLDAMKGAPPDAVETRKVLDRFATLSPSLVSETWCHE